MPAAAPSPAASVALEQVTKSFGEVAAVSSVTLSIPERQVVAIVGTSGCGKSTLLRLVAGLEQPSAGSVWLGGARVTGPSPRAGFVFQEHRLLPWLTVAENIAFGLLGDGRLTRTEREKLVLREVAKVHLSGFESAYPH